MATSLINPQTCFMESDCNRVLRELLGTGGGYWVVLGILGVLLGTARFRGVM